MFGSPVIHAGHCVPGGTMIDATISHIEDVRHFRLLLAEGHLAR